MIGEQVANGKTASKNGIMYRPRGADQASVLWQCLWQVDNKTQVPLNLRPVGDCYGLMCVWSRGSRGGRCISCRCRRGARSCRRCRRCNTAWRGCTFIAKNYEWLTTPVKLG